MQPEPALPTSIRACVHDSAIDRVSRFFNATLDDIFVELLQNARRASATEIRVSTSLLSEERWTVTVADDGAGIADPAILLSFAESAWTTQTASLEDPAGIGFYSLARHGCAVASRPLGKIPAWSARICPDAFLGKADVLVRPDNGAPSPHGTAISFVTDRNPDCVESILADAARHFPLPVRFNGRTLPFAYFLEHALHIEAWQGLTFGVYRNQYPPYPDPDVNFHGRTFKARLPSVQCITAASGRSAPTSAPARTSSWCCRPARSPWSTTSCTACARRPASPSTGRSRPASPPRASPTATTSGPRTPASSSSSPRRRSSPGARPSRTSSTGTHRPAGTRFAPAPF